MLDDFKILKLSWTVLNMSWIIFKILQKLRQINVPIVAIQRYVNKQSFPVTREKAAELDPSSNSRFFVRKDLRFRLMKSFADNVLSYLRGERSIRATKTKPPPLLPTGNTGQREITSVCDVNASALWSAK